MSDAWCCKWQCSACAAAIAAAAWGAIIAARTQLLAACRSRPVPPHGAPAWTQYVRDSSTRLGWRRRSTNDRLHPFGQQPLLVTGSPSHLRLPFDSRFLASQLSSRSRQLRKPQRSMVSRSR